MEDVGPIHAVWTVARDAAGRYWASFAAEDLPRVYSPDGKPIAALGRFGDGPGEFRAVLGIVAVADSVVLFDPVLRRMSVVDRELRVIRSAPVNGQVFGGVILKWPKAFVNAQINTAASIGYPFHILNLESGMIERSFGGSADGSYAPQDAHSMIGWIAKDSITGDVWTAMRTQFRIQRWRDDGRLVHTFTGLGHWFPPDARGSHGSPQKQPDGLVSAMSVDSRGVLFVALQAPGREWRSAWPKGATGNAGHPSPAQMPQEALLYDSYLAAIDGSSGNLIAVNSVRYAAMLGAQVGTGLLALEGIHDLYPSLIVLKASMRGHE